MSGTDATPGEHDRARAATLGWSAPATLSDCPGSSPRVLFPSNMPSRRTGPGAIVFDDGPGCRGGPGARVAALGAGELPLAPALPRDTGGRTLRLGPPLASAPAPHGQIAIAGFPAGRPKRGVILQGAAGGRFVQLAGRAPFSAPFDLTTAYLGDLAVALPMRGRGPAVEVERYFSNVLGLPRAAHGSPAPAIRELTVAMDYRSDALAAWVQGDSVYAEDLPASGVRHSVQRIGRAGSSVHLAALLSDDNRGMVAWQDRRGSQTSVHFDYSGGGVAFGPATLLERFRAPDGIVPPPASPRLIRLSSESVMLAWAGSSSGRWVVRTAAVDQKGIGSPGTIAAPEGDALLADLAPGPRGEALLLFSEPQSSLAGRADLSRQALMSARVVDTSPDRTLSGRPQLIAQPAPVGEASIAFDPGTDGAVAAWVAQAGAIEYSVHPGG